MEKRLFSAVMDLQCELERPSNEWSDDATEIKNISTALRKVMYRNKGSFRFLNPSQQKTVSEVLSSLVLKSLEDTAGVVVESWYEFEDQQYRDNCLYETKE